MQAEESETLVRAGAAMKVPKLCALISLLALSPCLDGAEPPKSDQPDLLGRTEGDFVIKSFRFRNGEVLDELRLHYLTLGTPHRDSAGNVDNAILLLHSTGSDTTELLEPTFGEPLYGPGKALDLTKFFVIIPDAIGHGRSSKPSNGMRARFPRYGYEDMVAAQHQLVTEKLGIKHLRLVLGLSMGGMHTWVWGERYPEMMDALFPIGALPVETGGRNRLWRHMIVEAIRNDPEWKHGDYEQQPHVLSRLVPIVVMMVGSPVNQYKRYPTRAAADSWYEGMIKAARERGDANDVLYRYDASSDYDPEPDLEKIKAPLTAIEFADDQINSPQFSVLDREMPRVKHGRYVIIPASEDTNGEADNIINAKLWKTHLQELLIAGRAASGR